MSSILLLAAVLAAHHGYGHWPTLKEQQWHFYVASQAGWALSLLLLLPQAERSRFKAAGVFACWLGAVECLQAAGCGALQWGQVVTRELCVQAFGPEFFYALASASLAAALALAADQWWRARHA